jgi:hypothetical protein
MKFIILSLLLLSPALAPAQALPEWASSYGSETPFGKSTHLTGFGMSLVETSASDALEAAKAQAAADLIKKIQVTVTSQISSVAKEIGNTYSSSFTSVTQSVSTLRVENIDFKTANNPKTQYALAFIDRGRLVEAYTEKAKNAYAKILGAKQLAEKSEQQKNIDLALKQYISTLPLFAESLEAITLVRVLSGAALQAKDIGVGNAPSALQAVAAQEQEVQAKLNQLFQKPVATIDDAVSIAVQRLQLQGVKAGDVQVADFTYQDSDFSSSFGTYLARKLDRQFAAVADKDNEKKIIKGSCWERGTSIELALLVQNLNGAKLGSVDMLIPKTAVPAEYDLKPKNFEQALRDQKTIAADGLVDGGVGIEVWTNKGRDESAVVFEEGDGVELYFRVNQPAHLRLTYLLSTGQKVLLEENFYIGIDKVNKVVKFPTKLTCSAPFGVERLITSAFSSEPPKPNVRLEKIEGEDYEVLTESLSQALSATRGLKKDASSASKPRVGEASLVITTMKRIK